MPDMVYDRIGEGYAQERRPEPRWQAVLTEVLGDARSVLNVGAGTGSYEPADRLVVAVEPSRVMIGQRPIDAAPVVQAAAENLPIATGTFDVATALVTIHHWNDWQAGLRELQRVAGRVVVLHFDPVLHNTFWLARDYLPELDDLWRDVPWVQHVAEFLGRGTEIRALPVPWDCVDGFLPAYWRRPEAYLDPKVQQSMSGLQLLDPDVLRRAVERLRADLQDGTWHARNAELLEADTLDVGWRLIIGNPL